MKINIEHIISEFKSLPARLSQVLKTIYSLPHSGKYLIVSLVFLILFLIITFPYDYLIRKKIYSLEGKSFRSIDISGFDFGIFSETYLDNLNLVLNDNDEINCKNAILNISLNPVTLLIKNKIKSDFQFDSLTYTGKNFEFIFNVNGNIDLVIDKKNNLPDHGIIKIILSDSLVKPKVLSIPGPMGPLSLNIESINIQSGNIDASIANKILKINVFKLTGSDIACDITGTVELSNSTNNSKLNLTVNIDPESAVLDQYKDILTPFIKNNMLSLRINGTFSRPELSLSNIEKNEN